VEDISRNLAEVKRHLDAACERSGREPGNVRLLPVSKAIDAVVAC
jgi:hypothetical protein